MLLLILHDRPINWEMSCWDKEYWLYSDGKPADWEDSEFGSQRIILPEFGFRLLIFFFFFLSFVFPPFLAAPEHMEFLGQGSDPSWSWDPSHRCGNARSFTHWARLGIETIIPVLPRHHCFLAPQWELGFRLLSRKGSKVKHFLVPLSFWRRCVHFLLLPAVIHRWAWSGCFLWAKQGILA